jgi:hypothetical protein
MGLIDKIKDIGKSGIKGILLFPLLIGSCSSERNLPDHYFGQYEAGAIRYIEKVLNENGYSHERNVFQLIPYAQGSYFWNEWDIRGRQSDKEIWIEYVSEADGFQDPHAASGIADRWYLKKQPPIVRIYPDDKQSKIKEVIEDAIYNGETR